jgi:hypothetical protein
LILNKILLDNVVILIDGQAEAGFEKQTAAGLLEVLIVAKYN